MKRIVTLLLAAGLVFGAFSGAKAADVKVKGQWDLAFEWIDNANFKGSKAGDSGEDDFGAASRLRTQIDVVASEALSGTVYFEIGSQKWGFEDGALGADGKVVKVKRSYIDWIVPQTDLKVRMGIQGVALPNFVAGSPVLDDDVAAITASYAFNQNVSVVAGWARPYNTDSSSSEKAVTGSANPNTFDEMDLAFLAVPVTLDGIKVTPWGMYGQIGKDVVTGLANSYLNTAANGYNTDSANISASGLLPRGASATLPAGYTKSDAYWAGLGAEVTMLDPFRFALDATYGSVKANGDNSDSLDRAGWMIIGAVDYKLPMMVPGIFAWYGSGDDSDATNGSERMPYIVPDFGPTSFGGSKLAAPIATDTALSISNAGTWGVGAQLKDITFIENLKHTLRVAYYKGTNAKEMAAVGTAGQAPWFVSKQAGIYMTEKDNAWEVNFDHYYKIYENLDLMVEMGYIKLNIDEDTWAAKTQGDVKADDAWKFGINLKYSF